MKSEKQRPWFLPQRGMPLSSPRLHDKAVFLRLVEVRGSNLLIEFLGFGLRCQRYFHADDFLCGTAMPMNCLPCLNGQRAPGLAICQRAVKIARDDLTITVSDAFEGAD